MMMLTSWKVALVTLIMSQQTAAFTQFRSLRCSVIKFPAVTVNLMRKTVVQKVVEEDELLADAADIAAVEKSYPAAPPTIGSDVINKPSNGYQLDFQSVVIISFILVLFADDFLHFLPAGGIIGAIKNAISPE